MPGPYEARLRRASPKKGIDRTMDSTPDVTGYLDAASDDDARDIRIDQLAGRLARLFLDYADMQRPRGGSTLGQVMAAEVASAQMPPGSCPWSTDAANSSSRAATR